MVDIALLLLGGLIYWGIAHWLPPSVVGVLTMRSYSLRGAVDVASCLVFASFEFQEVVVDNVELRSFLVDRGINRVKPEIPVSFRALVRVYETYMDSALYRILVAENSLARLRAGKLLPSEEEKFREAAGGPLIECEQRFSLRIDRSPWIHRRPRAG